MLKFSRLFHSINITLNIESSIKPSICNIRRKSSVLKNPFENLYFWNNWIQTNSLSVVSIGIISKVIENSLKKGCIIMIIHRDLWVDQVTIKDLNLLNLWINCTILHGKVYLGHQSHIQTQYFYLIWVVCQNQINLTYQGFRIT